MRLQISTHARRLGAVIVVLSAVALSASTALAAGDGTVPETTFNTTTTAFATGTSLEFRFSSNEPDASFQCSLDGAPPAPCASPLQISGLTFAVHTFSVRAVDVDGNVDPTPSLTTWESVPDIEPPVVTFGQMPAKVSRKKLRSLRGAVAASSGVARLDIALIYLPSAKRAAASFADALTAHNKPAAYTCDFVNLRTGGRSHLDCDWQVWATVKVAKNWKFPIRARVRKRLNVGNYLIRARAMNRPGNGAIYVKRFTLVK